MLTMDDRQPGSLPLTSPGRYETFLPMEPPPHPKFSLSVSTPSALCVLLPPNHSRLQFPPVSFPLPTRIFACRRLLPGRRAVPHVHNPTICRSMAFFPPVAILHHPLTRGMPYANWAAMLFVWPDSVGTLTVDALRFPQFAQSGASGSTCFFFSNACRLIVMSLPDPPFLVSRRQTLAPLPFAKKRSPAVISF